MSQVSYAHIEFREDGIPMLSGTAIKVVEIVLDHLAHHWSGEEIREAHPQLSLGQIHSALAFYYDHQDQIDADIERRRETAERIRQHLGPSAIEQKLRQLGKLP